MLKDSLQKANQVLNLEIIKQMNYSSQISSLSSMFATSQATIINCYGTQKNNMTEVYNTYIQSIDNITGHIITPYSLQHTELSETDVALFGSTKTCIISIALNQCV
jgi:hypothetical protein